MCSSDLNVLADANALHAQLGESDRLKLDEYLTGIRELELRLDGTGSVCGGMERPENPSFEDRVTLMAEIGRASCRERV